MSHNASFCIRFSAETSSSSNLNSGRFEVIKTLPCTANPGRRFTKDLVFTIDGSLQALQLVELEFQMAVRDQIIDEQRTMVGNLWKVLGELAPSERISDIASELGIVVDDATEGAPAVQV